MQLYVKDYKNYVSISGRVKPPKKMEDSPNSDNNKIKEIDDDYFTDLLNKYQNLLYINYKKIKNHDIENPINGIRTLTLRSSLYSWMLKNFDSNSMVTKLCFHDITLSRVWIDVEKQHHPER